MKDSGRHWGDTDPFLVNYVGHPMQGSVTGFIWTQNHPVERRLEFSSNPSYWRSRLKAMGWSAIYSTQFELGAVSEASLGNLGSHANRAPDFDLIYGLELLSTFDNQRAWVLFGDGLQSGEIEPGLPYLMLPAPRDQWSRQMIDPRQIFATLGITIAPPQPIETRFDALHFPKQMLNFRLLLAARRGSSPLIEADFGAVSSSENRADPAALIENAVID